MARIILVLPIMTALLLIGLIIPSLHPPSNDTLRSSTTLNGPKQGHAASEGSTDRKETRMLSLDLEVSPSLVPFELGNERFTTVDLKDDQVVAGPYGHCEHFINKVIEIDGELSQVSWEARGEVVIDAYPAPFIVPGTLSDGIKRTHPDWKGLPGSVIEEHYRTVLLSKDNVNGIWTYALRASPVRYLPTGQAIVPTSLHIEVSWHPEGPQPSAKGAVRKPLGDVDYLIIAHNTLLGPAQTLADWKSQKGVMSRVVTVENISKMYPVGDEQSKVRRFVMEMEQSHDLDYLLLVGDYDKVRTLNTRNIYPEVAYGEPSTFATDGYFACVDNGTTWDTNGNKVYAEGNEIDDPIPDMAVGRLAINDPTVLEAVLQGLIYRERTVPRSGSATKAVFMAGDPQNVQGDPTLTLDHFWEVYCDDVFDGRETLYYDGSGTMAFSSSSFRSVVGCGNQALCYFAHGTQTGLPNLFSNSQVGTLYDTGPDGLFFAMACLTGWFDDPNQGSMGHFTDCFAEALTESPQRGLVGYIGSSRLAVGYIDTEYSGDAPGLEEDFWRGVRKAVKGELPSTAGDIYRSAVTHFSQSFYPFPSNYNDYAAQRTFLEYNLLGDPEAPLFFRPPQDLRMGFVLSPNGDWVNAAVTNGSGGPVEGAFVTLFRSGELFARGTTDINGQVNISIPASNGGIVNLTAWRRGDRPVNTTVSLPDTLTPLAYHTITPEEPDGYGGCYIQEPELRLLSDEPALMEYSWDGGMPKTIAAGERVTVPEGSHTLTYKARDMVGLTSETVTVHLVLDLTLPTLTPVTDPPSPDGLDGWFITPPKVGLSSDEELYEAAVRVDDGPFVQLSGPITLGHGAHLLFFKARDGHGNWNVTSMKVKVDLELPISKLGTSHPPDGMNGYYRTQPTIMLENSDDRSASVLYRWDDGAWQEYLVPVRPERGVHLLEYRAKDISGNMEASVNNATFRYDPDLPDIIVKVHPDGPDGLNGHYVTRPSVTVTVDDATSKEGLEVFAVVAPPGEGVDWRGSYIEPNGTVIIKDGEWLLYLMARDVAGNTRTLPPIPFSVDTEIPDMRVSLYPPGPDGKNGWFIDRPVLWTNGSDPGITIIVELDNASSIGPLIGTLELPEGTHSVRVYPVDEAGNRGHDWTFEYRCDLTDPTAVIYLPKLNFLTGEPISVSAHGSSDQNGIMAYRFHLSDGRSTLWTDSPYWNWSFTDEGFYSLWVQVEDASGRTSMSRRVEVNITAPPPPDDDGTDDEVPVVPTDDDEGQNSMDIGLLLKISSGALMLLLIAILMMALVRRRSIQEVEWEDEDEDIEELDLIDDTEGTDGGQFDGDMTFE